MNGAEEVHLDSSQSGPNELESPSTDPFALFVSEHTAHLPSERRGRRFNAGEHVWLGGHGARRACEQLKGKINTIDPEMFRSIQRLYAKDPLQYGELVALSGDFYESAKDLFEERPAILPWLYEANDLSDLRSVFAHELAWIETPPEQRKSAVYPNQNLRLAWNAKMYVELALRNKSHFGWHNMLAYVENHEEALNLALESRGQLNQTFRRALCTNAFADHFLTDGFAAGHIRVPRAEICDWAARQGLDDRAAGAFSKLLHDQDGHVDLESLHGGSHEHGRPVEDGLRVCNAKGESWYARCDGQLFLEQSTGLFDGVQHAVNAVAASVRELLVAWKLRQLPQGAYEATTMVPFPHPQERPLVTKFPGGLGAEELERLWKVVDWYQKLPWLTELKRTHLSIFLVDLPSLMDRFRASVTSDVIEHAPRVARLAPAYVEAFKQIK